MVVERDAVVVGPRVPVSATPEGVGEPSRCHPGRSRARKDPGRADHVRGLRGGSGGEAGRPGEGLLVEHGASPRLDVRWFRLAAGAQRVTDEEVVYDRADRSADERSDDRDPEIAVDVAIVAGDRDVTPTGDQGEQARPEIACRVDRVAGVGSERDADGDARS
jgi:hypothetical protein